MQDLELASHGRKALRHIPLCRIAVIASLLGRCLAGFALFLGLDPMCVGNVLGILLVGLFATFN